jgi:adenylate cyclase
MAGKITTIQWGGGPCCGKSEIMRIAKDHLTTATRKVLVLSEMATLWHNAGFDYGELVVSAPPEQRIEVQAIYARFWMEQLKAAKQFARLYPQFDWVIMCDRGPIEAMAYIPRDEFDRLLKGNGWMEGQLRQLCDAAIHLQTAAYGKGYTQDNNAARRETPAEARVLDAELIDALIGHPKLRVVPNFERFEGKIQAALRMVESLLSGLEIERKFLLAGEPEYIHGVALHVGVTDIEQAYLQVRKGEQSRIRRSDHMGWVRHTSTVKNGEGLVRREPQDRDLHHSEYCLLYSDRDPKRQVIRKRRHYFVWDGRYWELDHIREPAGRECWVLEVELISPDEVVTPPPFLDIEREVTTDQRFSNAQIARA